MKQRQAQTKSEIPDPPDLNLNDGTKSQRITLILDRIAEQYRGRGVYNKMYETSDGSRVIRIDVRSVKALEKIEDALKEVDCPPLVKIVSLSTRYSCKKNGKKKGFNLFLKFENDSQRTFARYILESYCYEEKLWVVKDIPPKVLRTKEEETETKAQNEKISAPSAIAVAEDSCTERPKEEEVKVKAKNEEIAATRVIAVAENSCTK